MRRSLTMGVVFAALALIVAACGDDDAGGEGAQIAATATNFAFSPDLWTVATGEEVTLTLTNAADEDHEWVIMNSPITSEAEFAEDLVFWEMEAGPGAVATDTFTAPAAGTYQVICALEGHFDSGMEAELVVTG
ncbi:MAG TPA: plastocyanin/azurin family copper-binding protein [Acidimicrobiia bacterium]|nr:plastocyanin/azurin family copper-binding protein [Acidimicrobiia bacterium]